MNHKNARIGKLHANGLTPEQIARKLGLASTERVMDGLNWLRARGELVEPVKALDKSTSGVVES
jgi:hypothetical protein